MENCTIYSHHLEFEKVVQIVKANLPKANIEFNDGGTEKSLIATTKGGLFSKNKSLAIRYRQRKDPSDYQREVLHIEVRVEYDSAFRWKKEETNWTYRFLQELLPEFPHQITMGMDAAKHSYWRSYGGEPGLDFLLTSFKEDLERMERGEYYNHIFFHNPQQLYAFF